MKIALIGYGKMGKIIEQIALNRGHEVVMKIGHENLADFTKENAQGADVAIEFTQPEAAKNNVLQLLQWAIPVASGTTGWNNEVAAAGSIAQQNNTAFIHSSNYSLGVNLFFAANEYLASLMKPYPQYEVSVEEIHHTAKKDAPSGTAITLAERIMQHYPAKKQWILGEALQEDDLSIEAKRIDEVPGTHTTFYNSAIDSISITHTAHSREGFALGAVIAAEFLVGKKGVFTMKDVLGLQ